MQRKGKCKYCQKTRMINTLKRLCEICLAESTDVPSKRKRYFSEVSSKSGISAESAQTQQTEVDDDDLEYDGPSSDTDETGVKKADFDLQSVGSIIVNPVDRTEQMFSQSWSRDSLASISSQNRQIAQTLNRKRHPRLRHNFSESDSGNFAQRPCFGRRHSMFDQDVMEDCLQNESIVVVDQNFGSDAKVYLARPVQTVRSDPNLNVINRNVENYYESINSRDDASGYMQHQFTNPNIREDNTQQRLPAKCTDIEQNQLYDSCLQNQGKLKFVLVITIVIAWVPVAVLTALLLTSVPNNDAPLTTTSSLNSDEQLRGNVEDLKHRVDGIFARNIAAPLKLVGVGCKNITRSEHSYSMIRWEVPHQFVQNPITLQPDGIHVRVTMTGYYVVLCRINFIGKEATKKPFTIQQSLYKVDQGESERELDSVSQHCMFMNSSQIEHTSTLQTLVYLKKESQIYVRVRGIEYLDHKDFSKNKLGIFLLPAS